MSHINIFLNKILKKQANKTDFFFKLLKSTTKLKLKLKKFKHGLK